MDLSGDVMFAHYRSVLVVPGKRRQAKRVVLDEDNKVRYGTPWNFPWLDMSSATVILADCGVCMRKCDKPLRPSMPDHCLRLSEMFSTAKTSGICSDRCILCDKLGTTAEPVSRCSLCLVAMHSR